MRVHWLQHAPFEGLGSIEQYIVRRGYDLQMTALYRDEDLPDTASFDFLIIMGGPMGIRDTKKYPWLKTEKRFIKKAVREKKTILGICLGAQLLANALGARVYKGKEKEIGWFDIFRSPEAGRTMLHKVFPAATKVFHWHGETFDIPEGARRLAGSKLFPNQGFVWEDRVVALQFHLEMTPETVALLIENSREELELFSSGIQGEKELLQKAEIHFQKNNRLMNKILEVMTRVSRL